MIVGIEGRRRFQPGQHRNHVDILDPSLAPPYFIRKSFVSINKCNKNSTLFFRSHMVRYLTHYIVNHILYEHTGPAVTTDVLMLYRPHYPI